MASLHTMLRRASSFLGFEDKDGSRCVDNQSEGEVIFCKNNVCIHPPLPLQAETEHHPGYLSISVQPDSTLGSTFVLTWIPNSTLKKNSQTAGCITPLSSPNRSARSSACPSPSPRRSPRHSVHSLFSDGLQSGNNSPLDYSSMYMVLGEDQNFPVWQSPFKLLQTLSSMGPGVNVGANLVHSYRRFANVSNHPGAIDKCCKERPTLRLDCGRNVEDESEKDVVLRKEELKLRLEELNLEDQTRKRDLQDGNSNVEDGLRKTPDEPKEAFGMADTVNISRNNSSMGEFMGQTTEVLAAARNMTFPDQSATCSPSKRMHQSGFFSVDLGLMRSLRLFFSNKECTCGQLVIASRESQYKIFHFHHGGLDKLAKVFEEWKLVLKPKMKQKDCAYKQFFVSRPIVLSEECHPEEGSYEPLDESMWSSFLTVDGQIEEEIHLRKLIFFAGVNSTFRKEVWPFLLLYYPFISTFSEREDIQESRVIEYVAIVRKRASMTMDEKEAFCRNIQCTVEKDVVRTDRSNPFFAGENNPNVETMKNILLNYAVYNPSVGYTQGMSDLLAPVLSEIQDEVCVFWCFASLMQRTIFVSTPTDNDIDKTLCYLRELLRLMYPEFFEHLRKHPDAMDMLFCHRWILLCFKREFPEVDTLRIWEACWANYQTDYFHLFVCTAIITIYGQDVIEQDLRADEMLLHFLSLAMHMEGDLILRKARGLLYQFRMMPQIPCTLKGLCELCGPGIWDSDHIPAVVCVLDGQNSCSCVHPMAKGCYAPS